MTIADLQGLIAQGENTNVAFKSAKLRPDTLAKEIVAIEYGQKYASCGLGLG